MTARLKKGLRSALNCWPTTTSSNPGFGPFTFPNPMATGNMTTVQFKGRNAPNFDYLDDVVVTPAIPEPGSVPLLILGIRLLILTRCLHPAKVGATGR
jgi:hypothetical protein